jgi:hypothetical protein
MKKQPLSRRPRSYVVRIYRQSAKALAGHVEDVQSGAIHPFKAPAELWLAIGGTVAARPKSPRPQD